MDRRDWSAEQLSNGNGCKGVQCPNCASRLSTVYATKNRNQQIRRTRICGHCGTQFVTFERVAQDFDQR